MRLETVEKKLLEFFSKNSSGVHAAYLFGSLVQGRSTERSDVDIAILLKAGRPRTLLELPTNLESDLTELLGRQVDLIVLNGAPPDLIHRVLRDGKMVCDRDRSHRIAFELRARNEYFDVKPYIDEYRRPRQEVS